MRGSSVPALRRITEAVLRVYMRSWHQLTVEGHAHLPSNGPALILTNHTSILDVLALTAANPYPDVTTALKASAFRVPLLPHLLEAFDVVPLERNGRDVTGLRALRRALQRGRVVVLAAEGTRSPTGRLGAINPVLARFAASVAVPIIPVAIVGSFAALPRGRRAPRHHPIVLRVGRPFHLDRTATREEASGQIQQALAALLPADQQPERGGARSAS